MKRSIPAVNTLTMIGVATLALGAGFGIARLSAPSETVVDPAKDEASASAPAEAEAAQEVAIPKEYLAAAGISVEPVTSAQVAANITASGSVVAIPGGEAVVVARAAGNVTDVIRQVGDKVKKGEVLARVASPDGARIAADLRVASASLSLAEKNVKRDESLLAQGVLARQEAEASRAAYLTAQAEAQRAALVARPAPPNRRTGHAGGGQCGRGGPLAGGTGEPGGQQRAAQRHRCGHRGPAGAGLVLGPLARLGRGAAVGSDGRCSRAVATALNLDQDSSITSMT